jgi:hypothetical protein
LFLGGSVSEKRLQKGELPECQLLGFVDGRERVGCMAHPLAETSRGYDGRDRAGFFHHTGCCEAVGCEASREFPFLSASAMKVFDGAVAGMSWYEYSRHAISVLVYYLRSYDSIIQRLDDKKMLDAMPLQRLVGFTNTLYEAWPLRNQDRIEGHCPEHNSNFMDSLDILSTDIPLAERITYISLDTWFPRGRFAAQLRQARDRIERCIKAFAAGVKNDLSGQDHLK